MKVIWNLTRLCSWNCLICCVSAIHVNTEQKEIVYMDLARIGEELLLDEKKKILDDLYDNNVESIDFSGGDLLLREDDIKLIQYASTKFDKSQLSISIPGTRLTKELIRLLKKCVSSFDFTLDSLKNEVDGSRPNGYAQTAIKAILSCKEENIPVSISTVLKRGNCSIKNLEELHNFLIENNIESWEILPYYQVGRALDMYALTPTKSKMNSAISYINNLKNNSKVNISFQHSLENKINKCVKCNALSRSVGILPSGTVVSCSWGLKHGCTPINDKFILGYMPDSKFYDILNSEKSILWNKNKFKDNIQVCQLEENLNALNCNLKGEY